MVDAMRRAPRDKQLALIRAHPDLAGRAAIRGGLTAASSAEQASAGLDQCTPAEFERFRELNGKYKEKFHFPFIMAVKGKARAGDPRRFRAASRQFGAKPSSKKPSTRSPEIARLRLADLIRPEPARGRDQAIERELDLGGGGGAPEADPDRARDRLVGEAKRAQHR